MITKYCSTACASSKLSREVFHELLVSTKIKFAALCT